eukprot:Gb_12411 [translate_table: standard]
MMPVEFPSLGSGTGLIKGNSMKEGGRPRSLVLASFHGRERKESPSDVSTILYRSEPLAVLASSDCYTCISAIPDHRRWKGCRDTFRGSCACPAVLRCPLIQYKEAQKTDQGINPEPSRALLGTWVCHGSKLLAKRASLNDICRWFRVSGLEASVRGDGTPCQQYNIGPSGCTPGGPNPESRAKERTGDAWGRAGSRYLPRTGVLLFIVFTEGSQTSSVYYKWPGLLWQFCDWAFGSRRPNRLKLKPQNVPVYALSISLASSVGEMLAAWPAIDLFRPDPKVAITGKGWQD